MEILIINSGSSSLKYQLIDSQKGISKVRGLVDRIGIDGSSIKYVALKDGKEVEIKKQLPISNHEEAMKQVTDLLTDAEVGVISNPDDIKAVGHRVVHGGEKFVQPTLVTEEVKKEIEKLIPLSPLHNPACLEGIRSAEKIFKKAKHVAVLILLFINQCLPKRSVTLSRMNITKIMA